MYKLFYGICTRKCCKKNQTQCLKCLMPVKTIAILCLSAIDITFSSSLAPPGCIILVIENLAATSILSALGKSPSDAKQEPFALSPACSQAILLNQLYSSDLHQFPKFVYFRHYYCIAFTCLTTFHAKNKSSNSAFVGVFVTTLRLEISISITSLSCTSTPPTTFLYQT